MTGPLEKTGGKSVAIVGGGLAGLAAGCALADSGFAVTLFERKPYVGGRASSYEHPGTGEVIDNCQHLLLGCCTNLIDFYERLGVAGKIRWYDQITFVEPGGRASRLSPSFLPAPLHNVPGFLASSMLSFGDKLAISWALTKMMGSLPADGAQNFQDWLVSHHQTRRAISRFWGPVLVSALSEDLDRISVHYAAQVFRESFLKSAAAGRIGLPSVPLSDLYSSAAEYIRVRGGEALLRSSVSALAPTPEGVHLTTASGSRQFDFAVLAVAFQAAAALLPDEPAAAPLKDKLGHFDPAPITGIHLWFDREVTPLPHAVLLDRTIQWMFQKSRFHDGNRQPEQGSYLELVVSASKSLVQKSREEVLEIALRELAEFFPAVKQAKVLKAAVVKEVYATYSVVPGLDQYRPGPSTPWPRLFLAGDWIATGWPATMEGAVRSGRLAAQAVSAATGRPKNFLTPDLPPAGLMKLF